MKTYPLFRRLEFWHAAVSRVPAQHKRKKDGKDHRYSSTFENRRVTGAKTVQRTVLYLGEINDQQQVAWRKTLEVFDEAEQRYTTMSLFPEAGSSRRRGQRASEVERARTAAAADLW